MAAKMFKRANSMKTVYISPVLVEIENRTAALCASIDPSDVNIEKPFDGNVEYEW